MIFSGQGTNERTRRVVSDSTQRERTVKTGGKLKQGGDPVKDDNDEMAKNMLKL